MVSDALAFAFDTSPHHSPPYRPVGSLANKATETVAIFQAAQYAAKWMPIDTKLSMKPTYIKVPVQTVERIKFYENEQLNMIVAQHAEEKETILAENAGLRSMMGLEGSSEAVEEIRETEDGVNRALLMSATEEIKRLRTRVTVLEGEAARHRVQSSGFFSFGGGGGDGVDSQQMAKLTTELARLEEDNGRQKWMIGEKDKQIKVGRGRRFSFFLLMAQKLKSYQSRLSIRSRGLFLRARACEQFAVIEHLPHLTKSNASSECMTTKAQSLRYQPLHVKWMR